MARKGKAEKRWLNQPKASILWVDDNPLNNLYERFAFANLGVFFESYKSNAEALQALKLGKFDLVITDVRRDHSNETGWDLLTKISKLKPELPVIIYTFNIAPDTKGTAIEYGAIGVATTPQGLSELILSQLSRVVAVL